MPETNFETFVKVATLATSVFYWIHNNRAVGRRNKIKADFEILKLSRDVLGPDHDLSIRIVEKLERKVPLQYRKHLEPRRDTRRSYYGFAVVFAVGAGMFFFGEKQTMSNYGVSPWTQLVAGTALLFLAGGAFIKARSKDEDDE